MSPASSISWEGLAASLLLVAVALAVSWRARLGLEASIVWSCTRAAAQLIVTGWALALVLRPNASIAWSWLWVVAMILVAGLTVRQRAPEVPAILPLSLVATAAVATVSLGVIFGFHIFPVEARTIIPLAGMMIGNSMTAVVVAARRVVGELSDKRMEVEARLALGRSWKEASRPYLREAMRTAMIPQIESTKAVGLVFLPGAMTGLILAGVSPVHAVQVQLAIMYLILGSVATSVIVIGVGFDPAAVHARQPAGAHRACRRLTASAASRRLRTRLQALDRLGDASLSRLVALGAGDPLGVLALVGVGQAAPGGRGCLRALQGLGEVVRHVDDPRLGVVGDRHRDPWPASTPAAVLLALLSPTSRRPPIVAVVVRKVYAVDRDRHRHPLAPERVELVLAQLDGHGGSRVEDLGIERHRRHRS